MFRLLFAQAAASSLSPPPEPHRTGSLLTLFSGDDYPKQAARHHWQGAVVADLTVSAEGSVSDCRIMESSGYEVLDAKTCEILKSRARFVPAKDSEGRPTVDVFRTPRILWRLAR